MSKHNAKILNLTDKTCRMGKIGNNTESHGDEYVSGFTIPITGLMLTKDELNKFMNDKDCHASWFDTKGSLKTPMPWWGEEDFAITPQYEADELAMVFSGDRKAEFEREEEEKGDDGKDTEEGRAACSLSKIVLKPQQGGLTEMCFHLYVLPGIGKINLLLQEHQHREVKLTLTNGVAVEKKSSKQQALGLEGGGPAENGAEESAENGDDTKAFGEGVERNLAAHKGRMRGTVDGTSRTRQ